ncbi:murein L,D-transpeptidase catalytic domain family protein [Hymenobacter sp. B81]|uniref:murein L,D-transpeptidase catalytic domain family protein n=1 Tax=Hymenobacter sp. B81 TaxID=3344878 RepID=UPI0037DC3134
MTPARFFTASLLVVLALCGQPAAAAPPQAAQARYLAAFEQHLVRTYVGARLAATGLDATVLRKALIGYYNLRSKGLAHKPILTIIDFGRSSRLNRLWVIDLDRQKLLFHTLVAHGKNTGAEFARTFSNRAGSEQSSLGFYLTQQTYQGKHGLSLKLRGMDEHYNSNANARAVVVHGAEYVSQDFVRQHGRLGRSQGCPALPTEQSAAIIKAIKGGSVIYAEAPPSTSYQSGWLNLDAALPVFARSQGISPVVGQ